MDSRRTFKRLLVTAVAFFGLVIALGVVTAPDDRPNTSAVTTMAVRGYSHDQLQRDANMTQQMSAPNAARPMPHGQVNAQLERSQSPAYVRALEQHQANIERMLAQGAP